MPDVVRVRVYYTAWMLARVTLQREAIPTVLLAGWYAMAIENLGYGLLVAAVYFGTVLWGWRATLLRKVRQQGPNGCELEVSAAGVTLSDEQACFRTPWSALTKVRETGWSFEFRERSGTILLPKAGLSKSDIESVRNLARARIRPDRLWLRTRLA